jgi:alkane 1-monooxygenase
VPAQFIDAWQLSVRSGRTRLRNTVLQGLTLQCLVIFVLWSALSGWVALAVIFHAGVAVFLLEYVNYIQHYGLSRDITERIAPRHAWESQTRWSRWTLLELPLHPAHHLNPSLPFWQLDMIEGAPTLPTGYYGLFWPCLFPPLWKRWIDPRIPTTP